MAYNNPQILNIWRNEKSFPPLYCGVHVMLQNQKGNFLKKWEKLSSSVTKKLSSIRCQD